MWTARKLVEERARGQEPATGQLWWWTARAVREKAS